LVPDEPTIELWRQSIENNTKVGRFHPDQDTLVLDGIPRNVRQAEILKDTLNVVAVFLLKSADEKKLINRIQRRAIKENRLDDANLDVIRDRLHVYENETKPVLNFYGKKVVHHINADQTPAKVLADILHIAATK
jgi:adenylate kinase